MKTLVFNKEDLEHALASTASETCNQLARLGIITPEQAEAFVSEWTPMLVDRISLIEKLRKLVFRDRDMGSMLIRFIKLNEVEPQIIK